jgi:hypothetical protein
MEKTRILFKKTFFIKTKIYIQLRFSENCAVYEIAWKNVAEPDWPQMTYDTAHAPFRLEK